VREKKPIGILTDRDIVVRVLDKGLDAATTRVEAVMTKDLLVVEDSVEPLDAAARMRARQVRRIPIVGADGSLVGLVTFDDLIHHFGRGLDALADVIGHFPVPHFGG
jgi:CBS domain-containing protein